MQVDLSFPSAPYMLRTSDSGLARSCLRGRRWRRSVVAGTVAVVSVGVPGAASDGSTERATVSPSAFVAVGVIFAPAREPVEGPLGDVGEEEAVFERRACGSSPPLREHDLDRHRVVCSDASEHEPAVDAALRSERDLARPGIVGRACATPMACFSGLARGRGRSRCLRAARRRRCARRSRRSRPLSSCRCRRQVGEGLLDVTPAFLAVLGSLLYWRFGNRRPSGPRLRHRQPRRGAHKSSWALRGRGGGSPDRRRSPPQAAPGRRWRGRRLALWDPYL
jgi:hypothetical protein